MQIITLVLAAAIAVSAKPSNCVTSATAAVRTYGIAQQQSHQQPPLLEENYNPYNASAPMLKTMHRPPAVETKSVYIPPVATQLYSGASSVTAPSAIAVAVNLVPLIPIQSTLSFAMNK
ncbi:UNVERIFIED_CONTAM: hypothetical protein HDU68_010987 [Siphonaria sp. JEL0065]|nr:hypothetical protein HDU68_010987 [Siphonaria sp. JEL0065]